MPDLLLSERGMRRENGVVDARVCDHCHCYLNSANGARSTPTEFALVCETLITAHTHSFVF